MSTSQEENPSVLVDSINIKPSINTVLASFNTLNNSHYAETSNRVYNLVKPMPDPAAGSS